MGVTTLYRWYDADDRLLYVGITERGDRRFKEHRKGSGWWEHAVRSTVEHFPSRLEAKAAETRAIKSERPVWNKAENPAHGGVDYMRPGDCRRESEFWMYARQDERLAGLWHTTRLLVKSLPRDRKGFCANAWWYSGSDGAISLSAITRSIMACPAWNRSWAISEIVDAELYEQLADCTHEDTAGNDWFGCGHSGFTWFEKLYAWGLLSQCAHETAGSLLDLPNALRSSMVEHGVFDDAVNMTVSTTPANLLRIIRGRTRDLCPPTPSESTPDIDSVMRREMATSLYLKRAVYFSESPRLGVV